MAFALNLAKPVFADVGILRRESDEALFGQPDSKPMVVSGVNVRISHVSRPALEAVLADHYRPPLALFDTLRHQQNPVGKDSWPDIQHYLITAEFRLVIDEPRAGIRRDVGVWKTSNHLVPDVIAQRTGCLLPVLW